MNLQQLKYVIAVAEAKSITKAAGQLYISQPSLSSAIKDLEAETGIVIFVRSRTGVTLTKDGMEFLGYARQVLQQMELLEDKYITVQPGKTRFGVSTQHYTFTENAFVELVQRFGQERYEFYFNEAGTHQILEDVKNRISDIGIIYLSNENETVLRKMLEEYGLEFVSLFSAKPHVFLQRNHPLAGKQKIRLAELVPYPRLNFVQGSYESSYYAEELFSTVPADKEIRINDRGAIVNFMLGLNAYTISSGIFPKYLHGDNIVAVPLDEPERMEIGYIFPERQPLSELGAVYIRELMKYAGAAYILYLAVHIAVSRPAESQEGKSASFAKGFLLQFVNVKIYMFGITALTGFVVSYNSALTSLLFFEAVIATIGMIATGTWIAGGLLIQKFYLKHYRVINIVLALTLLECVYSILR